MARRFLAAATLLTVILVPSAYADTYRVRVNRIESNLYQDQNTKVIIETRLCLELALGDDAVLRWEGRYGNSWIVFSNGNKCDVVDLR